MKLPFTPWLPDLPALGNPGMTDAKNVIPASRGYQPFRSINPFTAVSYTHLTLPTNREV